MTKDFIRHLRPEWSMKKRATFRSTFRPFQSVEVSLHRLLPSRAGVRFAQLDECIFFNLTQFNEQTLSISLSEGTFLVSGSN